MKKTISLILALVTVSCVASYSEAKGHENHLAVVKCGDIIKVIYKRAGSLEVRVTISDADGNEVFREKLVSQSGFIRPYNFSLLPKGDYKICVTDDEGEHLEKISSRDKEWLAHVAKLRNNEQKYLVTIPNQGSDEVSIQVYDRNDKLVYAEQTNLHGDFARIYYLKNLDGGATFHIENQSTGQQRFFGVE